MQEYVCVKDLYMCFWGDKVFTKGKRYTNIYKGRAPYLEFIDDSGTPHEVSDGGDFDDENWIIHFVKLQDYGDYLIDVAKEYSNEVFTWYTMNAPKTPSWGIVCTKYPVKSAIKYFGIETDEYLEDKYLEEAYKQKKSNKLNKEMEELKITKEKVLAASKLGSKEEEVLKTLFPEVFEDGYFKFGKCFETTTSNNGNPLLIGWGLVDEEHSGKILLVNRDYQLEVLNNVCVGNYVGLKFKKKEQ